MKAMEISSLTKKEKKNGKLNYQMSLFMGKYINAKYIGKTKYILLPSKSCAYLIGLH